MSETGEITTLRYDSVELQPGGGRPAQVAESGRRGSAARASASSLAVSQFAEYHLYEFEKEYPLHTYRD